MTIPHFSMFEMGFSICIDLTRSRERGSVFCCIQKKSTSYAKVQT